MTNVTELDLVTLESLAYRQLVELDRIQNNIKVIQTEIERKQNMVTEEQVAPQAPAAPKETIEQAPVVTKQPAVKKEK